MKVVHANQLYQTGTGYHDDDVGHFQLTINIGVNLPHNDAWTESLVTNIEVLAVNQTGKNVKVMGTNALLNNVQVTEDSLIPIWCSESMDKKTKYLAFSILQINHKRFHYLLKKLI